MTLHTLHTSKDVWGPAIWTHIHIVTLSAPMHFTEKTLSEYRSFFILLGSTLPCQVCKTHFLEYLRLHPQNFRTRNDIIVYYFDLHNNVNKRLNKPTITYEQFIRMYVPECLYTEYGLNKDDIVIANNSTRRYSTMCKVIVWILITMIFVVVFCQWTKNNL
jgi:hypothetical protein